MRGPCRSLVLQTMVSGVKCPKGTKRDLPHPGLMYRFWHDKRYRAPFCVSEDLWLQYIQEELGPLGQPENCGKIHWRAMKFLEGESVERFISKYTLLQTGHLWAITGQSLQVQPPAFNSCWHGSSSPQMFVLLLLWFFQFFLLFYNLNPLFSNLCFWCQTDIGNMLYCSV